MKTLRMTVCVILAVVMLTSLVPQTNKTTTHIETTIVPLGVGDIAVPATEESATPVTGGSSTEPVLVTTSLSENGILSLDIDTSNTGRLKVKITKDDQVLYYDVDSDYHLNIPLQLGDGDYTVKVFRQVTGNEYESVYSLGFSYQSDNPNDVFLASSDIVNFDSSSALDGLTQQVVGGATDDREIVTLIADYVIDEFSYDTQKITTLSTNYIPNIDGVLADKSGICYDFAAVTAAMLREAGIPTKLVMGYRTDSDLYHAWNEVWIDGEWMVVDTTWDNVMNNRQLSFQNPELYLAEKVF